MSDLHILWTRQLKLFAPKLVVSASGSHVAAAFTDFKNEYNIAVYDGKTGTELTRLPLKGIDGIALSPDGKLVAVVKRSIGKDRVAVPTINIYKYGIWATTGFSGHMTELRGGRRQFLESGRTVSFTSDGKYMVTSGMTHKSLEP